MAITRSTRRASAHVAGRARRNLACWSLSRDETQAARLTQAVVAGLTLAVLGASATSHAQAWRTTPSVHVRIDADRQRRSRTATISESPTGSTSSRPRCDSPGKARDRVSRAISRCRYCCMRGRRRTITSRRQVDIAGNAELIEKFLFIDVVGKRLAAVPNAVWRRRPTTSRTRPTTGTRRSRTRVSPYLRGLLGNNLDYELRDSNIWSVGNGVGQHERRCVRQFLHQPYHAAADAARLVAVVRPDCAAVSEPAFRAIADRTRQCALSGRPGARAIRHASATKTTSCSSRPESGVTYGVGGTWHPTDRTNVDAKWEHRFFGASYNVLFDHRTPLSVWSLRASRDITNYPAAACARCRAAPM